jgi:Lon protease-like protein
MSSASAAIPIFPLPNAQLFPLALLPLHVFEPRYREMVRDCMAGDRMLAVALLEPGYEHDYGGRPPVRAVCGVGRILAHEPMPDGRSNILLRGEYRGRILDELPADRSYRLARIEKIEDIVAPTGADEVDQTLRLLSDQLSLRLPAGGETLRSLIRSANGAGALADVLAATLLTDPDLRQELLETEDVVQRARRVVDQLGMLLARVADHEGPSN